MDKSIHPLDEENLGFGTNAISLHSMSQFFQEVIQTNISIDKIVQTNPINYSRCW